MACAAGIFNSKAAGAAKGQREAVEIQPGSDNPSRSHQKACLMFQIGWQWATWCSCMPNMVAEPQQATSDLSLLPGHHTLQEACQQWLCPPWSDQECL